MAGPWGRTDALTVLNALSVTREAWQLEHLGFIERERNRPVDVEGPRPQDPDAQQSEFGFIHFLGSRATSTFIGHHRPGVGTTCTSTWDPQRV